MKKIILLTIVLITFITTQAQFTSAKITAAGLTCAMCTKAIYHSLEKIAEISKVDTDIQNSVFLVYFKEGANVDPDALKGAVQNAGFSVAKFQLTGNFNTRPLDKDSHTRIGNKLFHFLNTDGHSSLKGTRTITLVDKDYLPNKEFKKMENASSLACIHTGKAEKCCVKDGVAMNERIFHATL